MLLMSRSDGNVILMLLLGGSGLVVRISKFSPVLTLMEGSSAVMDI